MFSKYIHVVARVSASFLFMAEYYSFAWTDHILSSGSTCGHVDCAAVCEHPVCISFEHLFSFLLGVDLGVALLGPVACPGSSPDFFHVRTWALLSVGPL
jgi:hypothetical protein